VNSAFTNAIAGLTRNLASPLGAAGQTKYVSVLLRPEGILNQGNSNGFLGLVLESPTEPEVFFGKPGGGAIGQYVVEDRGGTGQFASNTPAVVNQTALLVLKAQFTQQNDVFTLYVNPTPGGPEPASGVVKNDSNLGTVNGLTIYSTGAFSVDEIRVGDTFADVTPVPEPSSAAAVGVASLLLARRRPRRRIHAA
jgi:hypothetical protein